MKQTFKNRLGLTSIAFLVVCTSNSLVGGQVNPAKYKADLVSAGGQTTSVPTESLTKEETEGLLFMREEEKLAQNVYTVLAQKWGSRPFGNISQAEFSHTSWVEGLLAKYKVEDPAANLKAGKFKNETLQKLYDDLVKAGSRSRVEALRVGATIEDVDLFDLARWIKVTKQADIKTVYESLAKGSRNHMRAFYRNLKNAGVTYKPQYISQKDLDKIISSSTERGGR